MRAATQSPRQVLVERVPSSNDLLRQAAAVAQEADGGGGRPTGKSSRFSPARQAAIRIRAWLVTLTQVGEAVRDQLTRADALRRARRGAAAAAARRPPTRPLRRWMETEGRRDLNGRGRHGDGDGEVRRHETARELLRAIPAGRRRRMTAMARPRRPGKHIPAQAARLSRCSKRIGAGKGFLLGRQRLTNCALVS